MTPRRTVYGLCQRHIAVATGGLLLEVLATPASTQDREAARLLLFNLTRAHCRVRRAGHDHPHDPPPGTHPLRFKDKH